MTKTVLLLTILMIASPASGAEVSPYAGEEHRQIKTLSKDEIAALSRGEGMGFAKAAELNRYPGPRHVLELAAELELSVEQARQTAALFEEMQAQAMAIGNRLIAAEAELDRLFSSGSIDGPGLKAQLFAIGQLRSELRYIHLEAHLQQEKILSQHQVTQYVRLRGYNGDHDDHH